MERQETENIIFNEQPREINIFENCLFDLFFCLSRTINSFKQCWNYLYDNYDCFQETTDTISYLSTYTCNTIYQKRTEPFEVYWWSICRINKYKFEKNGSLEEIILFERPSISRENVFIIYHFIDFYVCFYNRPPNNSSINQSIELFERWNTITPKKSNIRFLSIQYTHPELEEPIELNLENQWYFVGNELLGKIHILRILEYQFSKSQYIFDERYILKIIDSDIHIFEITAEQYIRLEEDKYDIIG
jgi:hypothetical protein